MTSDRSSDGLPASAVLLLTIGQVAKSLQVSERSVFRHIRAGQLQVVRIGRSVRIRPADLETFIKMS